MIVAAGKSWLHPVRNPSSDDIQAPDNGFDFDLSSTVLDGHYQLQGNLLHEDTLLSSLISQGQAKAFLHLECPRTYFRRVFEFGTDSRLVTAIPHDTVRGKAEVLAIIVAVSDLPAYRHPQQNPDYGDHSFRVSPAEFLAVSGTKQIEFYPDMDQLPHISSLLTIRKGEEGLDRMDINPTENRIVVLLPPEEHKMYSDIRLMGSVRDLLVNGVVMPALLHSLHFLRAMQSEELEDFKAGHRWARLILERLAVAGFPEPWSNADPSDCVKGTLHLLRGPLKKSLNQLVQLILTPKSDES
jgi:hypothetical protein